MAAAAGDTRKRRQGPVRQLHKACDMLGWKWDCFDFFTRPGKPALPVAEGTLAWFAHEVRDACRQACVRETARLRRRPRHDLRLDGQDIDYDSSCFLLRGPWSNERRRGIRDRIHQLFGRLKEPYVRGILKNVLVASIWTGVRLAKAKVIATDSCPCGYGREDAAHIFWNCPRWDSIRIKYGFTAAWQREQHWTFLRTGLRVRSPDLERHLNSARPWRPPAVPPRPSLSQADKDNVDIEDGFAVWFTDGGSLCPNEPQLRRAGSGGWLRPAHPCNFSLPVGGPIQTNNEAEAFAILVVVIWAWRPTKIISDSEWAVTRMHMLLAQGGADIEVGRWDHPAIWRQIQDALKARQATQVLSVEWTKGHASFEDIAAQRSTLARQHGNNEADSLATLAARSQEVPGHIRDAYYQRFEETAKAQAMMTEIVLHRYLSDMRSKRQDADHNDTESQLGQAQAPDMAATQAGRPPEGASQEVLRDDEHAQELSLEELLSGSTPRQIWARRDELWGLHPWQMSTWTATDAEWVSHELGAPPQKLGLNKLRNIVDGIDTQWNYPRPLFFALRWYLGRLKWTRSELAARTPWWLLAADFEMATGLQLATVKSTNPVDLSARSMVIAKAVRRVGELCRCDPVPYGYAKDCHELRPFGLGSASGVWGIVDFLTTDAPYLTIVSLLKQRYRDPTLSRMGVRPDYTHAPPILYDVRSDSAVVQVQGGHAMPAAARGLPARERREASFLARITEHNAKAERLRRHQWNIIAAPPAELTGEARRKAWEQLPLTCRRCGIVKSYKAFFYWGKRVCPAW